MLVGVGHKFCEDKPRIDAVVDAGLQGLNVNFPSDPPGFQTVTRILQPHEVEEVLAQVGPASEGAAIKLFMDQGNGGDPLAQRLEDGLLSRILEAVRLE
jgi:hypothetical protein